MWYSFFCKFALNALNKVYISYRDGQCNRQSARLYGHDISTWIACRKCHFFTIKYSEDII